MLGQLAAPNHADWVGTVGGAPVRLNRVAAAPLARVEARPVLVVAPAALKDVGHVASLEFPMSEVDDLEVVGKAHATDVRDLQAVVTVMNQPAQRLRAFAGQHAMPSDELALVERPRRREPVLLVPALARSRHVRAAHIPPHTRSGSVKVPKRAQLERMIGRGALDLDPRVIGHAQ